MGIETIIAVVMMIGLTLYAVLGGADFGAGVWEFNTVLRATPKERALLYNAIGPVWEANHVWLIFVVVILVNAFPLAYATLSQALWLPLLLALGGIIFRGVGFAFRSHAAASVKQQEIWSAIFALASTAAPFFLGAAAWTIASGKLTVTADGDFSGDFLTGWLNPMSIFGAFFAVGVCAYLTSVYLTREAAILNDNELVQLWRRRAIATGMWMGILAITGLALVYSFAPDLWNGFSQRAWPMVGASIASGISSLIALFYSKFTLAVLFSATTVATVIWGWGLAQFPAIISPSITIFSAKAPEPVLHAMLIGIAAGALVLIPSLVLLFSLFKGKRPNP